MPLHVRLVCIGLNVVTAFVIGFIAIFSFSTHRVGLGVFFAVWAATAAYSAYEMDKVRRFLLRDRAPQDDIAPHPCGGVRELKPPSEKQ